MILGAYERTPQFSRGCAQRRMVSEAGTGVSCKGVCACANLLSWSVVCARQRNQPAVARCLDKHPPSLGGGTGAKGLPGCKIPSDWFQVDEIRGHTGKSKCFKGSRYLPALAQVRYTVPGVGSPRSLLQCGCGTVTARHIDEMWCFYLQVAAVQHTILEPMLVKARFGVAVPMQDAGACAAVWQCMRQHAVRGSEPRQNCSDEGHEGSKLWWFSSSFSRLYVILLSTCCHSAVRQARSVAWPSTCMNEGVRAPGTIE
ncbi:hypothetical protein B0I35DRAFT_56568 [Stachybotrys elegans]|uniref:Uncharacterized protein n=1 Tax=Stachybotrys elegans TaxID=80388 RepID=A0A8K0WNF4_9HYPO|nr:hypothetical protein B0I35DRAFT_56568 [Stachybotrys elegans]